MTYPMSNLQSKAVGTKLLTPHGPDLQDCLVSALLIQLKTQASPRHDISFSLCWRQASSIIFIKNTEIVWKM